MAVSQVSVFVENQPGHLWRILEAFETAGINVRGYSTSDTGDYGIARFVLDQPDEGFELLRTRGFATTLADVLCVRLLDQPGELARVMGILAEAAINIPYSYSMSSTVIAIHTDDIPAAEAALRNRQIGLVSQDEISAGA